MVDALVVPFCLVHWMLQPLRQNKLVGLILFFEALSINTGIGPGSGEFRNAHPKPGFFCFNSPPTPPTPPPPRAPAPPALPAFSLGFLPRRRQRDGAQHNTRDAVLVVSLALLKTGKLRSMYECVRACVPASLPASLRYRRLQRPHCTQPGIRISQRVYSLFLGLSVSDGTLKLVLLHGFGGQNRNIQ